MSDNPVLVAPRPVRVISGLLTRPMPHPVRLMSAPTDQFERVKITDENDLKVGVFTDATSDRDRDLSSPRASSRSSLPSEALEEFLSILRPSFFPPTSPILRARRQGATTLTSFPYERPYPCKGRRLELVQQKHESSNLYGVEEVDRSSQSSRNTSGTPEHLSDQDDGILEIYDSDGLRQRWFTSNTHSSPISRMQTRNPFQRHPSYEIAFAGLLPSSPSPLSPSAVPLPLPTPDEMIEVA